MSNNFHVGEEINQLLAQKHLTKTELGGMIGMTQGNVTYLTKRPSIDVLTLQKIGNALGYDFFKHYPIHTEKEPEKPGQPDERVQIISELKEKISVLEKELAEIHRNLEMQKKENEYLREINALLKKGK